MAIMRSIAVNRAMETTATTGTGNYALEGPVAGYEAMSLSISNGQRVAYCAQQATYDGGGNLVSMDYEIGIGTLHHGAPDTLARTQVLQSTNGDAAVNWGPGEKTVFSVQPVQLVPMMESELGVNDEGRPLIVAPGSRGFTRGNVSLGQQAASELTIASGSITPQRAWHTVDTEADAASGELNKIETTNIAEGGLLLLSAENSARAVTINHAAEPGAGEIFLLTEADFVLDNLVKVLLLQRRGGHWVELFRGGGRLPLDGLAPLAAKTLIGNGEAAEGPAQAVLLGNTLAAISGTLNVVAATAAQRGGVVLSDQAADEAGLDEERAVTPRGVRRALRASGAAPIFACRAWVNFDGTVAPAIKGSGNVSSITKNGAGDYTINFATPLPDANYAVHGMVIGLSLAAIAHTCVVAGTVAGGPNLKSATQVRIQTGNSSTGGLANMAEVNVAVFR